jgi:hypothetical protein
MASICFISVIVYSYGFYSERLTVRKFGRIDDNQKVIVKQLRNYGCSVLSIASIGNGAPDIIVGFKGNNYLFELKDSSKPKSAQKLTADEIAFAGSWRGQIHTANNLETILRIILD